ncbi:hypothetical protein H4I96_11274 [Botrytis cinerea]
MIETLHNFLKKDGYLILPNSSTETGPINQKLAIIKNSECPELLIVAGHTSKEEDQAAHCHEMFFNQPYYIASGPKDDDPVFTAQFFGEKDIKNIPLAYKAMREAREITHRKSTDRNSQNDVSEFEQRMIGGSKKKVLDRRAYVQGFTITQQQDAICAAQLNAAIIANSESIGRLNQLVAIAAGHLLANCAPKEVLDHLAKQAESAVPVTFGHEDNKFFSTVQYNYSGVEIESLEVSLGNFGALHIDGHDDPTLWTAVHPHISLGPIPMGKSERPRLVAVCYPKEKVMRETPTLIRRSTPLILQTIKGLRSSLPEAHPIAIAAFGTRRNQMEFLARLEAHDKTKIHRINPSLKMPTADLFVQLWSWEENGVTMTPRVSRIQAVLDGDGETRKWYMDYSKKCVSILSMRWFDGKKKTETNWVSIENIGSTFAHLDILTSSTATPLEEFNKWSKKTNSLPVIKRNYGKLPYLCPCCELRFATKQRLQNHHNLAHKSTLEWQMPQPSVDPAYQKGNGEFDEEGEKVGEEQLAEETSSNDEKSSEEEEPGVKKRKR